MPDRFPHLVPTLLAASLLAACAPDQANNAPAEQAVGLPVDAPRITLLDAGDATVPIAFDDIGSEEQSVTVTVTDGFAQNVTTLEEVDDAAPAGDLGGGNQISLPLTGRTSPANDAAEGQREATRTPEYRLGDATIDDQGLLPDLRSAQGFRAGWRADDNGAISTVLLSAPDGASDPGRAITEGALLDMIALPVVFPTDPIGPGAQWTVETRVPGDTSLLRTITYTLVAHEDNVAELEVDVEERPTLGALTLEGTPGAAELNDTELTVESSDTAADGSLTVDLTHALPVAGQIAFTTRVVYSGANEQAVVQDSSTTIGYSTAP